MAEFVNKIPSMDELKIAIKEAVKNAVKELFKINENFYYLVLTTSGEAHPPTLSAGSSEGLERTVKKYVEEYGYDPHEPDLALSLKWSFADTPYDCFGYEEYFRDKDIERLFYLRPSVDDCISGKITQEEWDNEYDLRLKAMILALKELDEENVFERKEKRKHLFLNVAPEYLNLREFAQILNEGEALKEVIEDNALEDDGENVEMKEKLLDF